LDIYVSPFKAQKINPEHTGLHHHMRSLYQKLIDQTKKVNWTLLLFLVLLLNVKLIVKLAAFLIIAVSQYRQVSFKEIFRQKQLYFYFSLIGIGIINYIIQPKSSGINQALSAAFGVSLWVICLAAGYYLFRIVQKEEKEKVHNTVTFFFILHIGAVFLNLLLIMIECGSINPYTYKGFNQKYYISAGDFISGITFDSPVTTAMISAIALLYFLYRRYFFLSLAATVSMLIIASNLTNIFLVLVLLIIFIFQTNKLQKSLIIVQLCLLVIFTAKISPQNNEYAGRFAYKMLGMTYDLPKKIASLDLLKASPDSLLTTTEIRKKIAVLYLDSLSSEKAHNSIVHAGPVAGDHSIATDKITLSKDSQAINNSFYKYRETEIVLAKMGKFNDFILKNYPASGRDSLQKLYDWNKPGKWIAIKQIINFFKTHPGKLLLGAGTGNFSSRVAFKTTSLGIAGAYPAKFRYIHPWFHNNHLFLYTYYHSQAQPKHAAENTPDSTYGQLLSEYGIAGLLLFLLLYIGYFLRHLRKLTFGLPVMLLLLAAFFTEYWFEQLSLVILFELLLFVDMKSPDQKLINREEQAT